MEVPEKEAKDNGGPPTKKRKFLEKATEDEKKAYRTKLLERVALMPGFPEPDKDDAGDGGMPVKK